MEGERGRVRRGKGGGEERENRKRGREVGT